MSPWKKKSNFTVVRKMQIKTAVRYRCTPTRTSAIKKPSVSTGCGLWSRIHHSPAAGSIHGPTTHKTRSTTPGNEARTPHAAGRVHLQSAARRHRTARRGTPPTRKVQKRKPREPERRWVPGRVRAARPGTGGQGTVPEMFQNSLVAVAPHVYTPAGAPEGSLPNGKETWLRRHSTPKKLGTAKGQQAKTLNMQPGGSSGRRLPRPQSCSNNKNQPPRPSAAKPSESLQHSKHTAAQPGCQAT